MKHIPKGRTFPRENLESGGKIGETIERWGILLFPKCTVWAERQPLAGWLLGRVAGLGAGKAARAQGACNRKAMGRCLFWKEQSWRERSESWGGGLGANQETELSLWWAWY